MTRFAELLDFLPEGYRGIGIEHTDRSRLAQWLHACADVTASEQGVMECLSRDVTQLVFQPPDAAKMDRMRHYLAANLVSLRLLNKLDAPPYLAITVPLEDVNAAPETDLFELYGRLRALLRLQFVAAHCQTYHGKHEFAIAQVKRLFRTAAQLLASSFSGSLDAEGYYQHCFALSATLELAAHARASDADLLSRLIALVESNRLNASQFTQMHFVQGLATITHAVLNGSGERGRVRGCSILPRKCAFSAMPNTPARASGRDD